MVDSSDAMEVNRPTWWLKRPCPVCDQGSALVLVACPGCGTVALHCGEEGSVFLDVTDTECAPQDSACRTCGQHRIAEFPDATDVQIQRAGLTVADYH